MARRGQGNEDCDDARSPAGMAPEPMVNRTLERELLTEHVARVARSGHGHAVHQGDHCQVTTWECATARKGVGISGDNSGHRVPR